MLLAKAKCERCKAYSRFDETIREEFIVEVFGMAVLSVYEQDLVRCVICGEYTENYYDDNEYAWLYWYAWWNGEEPDGAIWVEDAAGDDSGDDGDEDGYADQAVARLLRKDHP
jgi:hypothetical protein